MIGWPGLPLRGNPFKQLSFTFATVTLLDAIAFLYTSLLTLNAPY